MISEDDDTTDEDPIPDQETEPELPAAVPEDPEVELHEDPGFIARIRRDLSYSLLWLSILAVPAGVLAAYGSNAFRLAIGSLGEWMHGAETISTEFQEMVALAAGGLLFGGVLALMKWERFRNPASVILAVRERGGALSLRGGVLTALCDGLSLSLGAPVGRYGPAVQLGATAGSMLGKTLGLSKSGMRILVGCGVAAAISASFNAPIAGVIFAHEVIIGHFALRAFAPITVASVAAIGITRFHGFEFIALKLSETRTDLDVWEYPIYAVLGAIAAGLAIVYMAGILRSGDLANRLKVPIWLQPAIGGAIAGAVGWWMPEVLGLGERAMQVVMAQDTGAPGLPLKMLAMLIVGKLIASVACLGLRYPGGVFTPAIFTGAMLGGVVGFLAPFLDYQICVLVGMGALVSSVVGAPIAIILIVFELTENYEAATAVMIGVVAANALVTRFYARSIFHRQIRRMGIDLDEPAEQHLMASRTVGELLSSSRLAVRPERTVAELRKLVQHGHRGEVFVVDPDQRLIGALHLARITCADDEQTAGELSVEPELWLAKGDDLWEAFVCIENFVGYSIPVVEDAESMKLVGTVSESDFITAFRQALREARDEAAQS